VVAGRLQQPRASAGAFVGQDRSVVATWNEADSAQLGPGRIDGVDAWHVVLEPVSSRGDVVLAGGARPFHAESTGRGLEGAAVLITVAGTSPDAGREREFFRRFLDVSRDIARAPGHLVSLVQAPAGTHGGPVLTLSVWDGLEAGVDWAYRRSRPQASAVMRQRSIGWWPRADRSVAPCAPAAARSAIAGTR
jgi:heme-degrading monooxygenase HmoA